MIRPDVTIENLNALSKDTMVEHLGIEYMEVGKDYLKARMPVDHRTHQPLKLLHGGASVALAETLGSVGAYSMMNPETHYCVGLEINANHIRAARKGWVYGTARPLHTGRTTHVWEIRIEDEEEKLVCISRITMAILERQ